MFGRFVSPLALCALLGACNAAPEGLSVSLTPETPRTTDTLEVVFDAEAVDKNEDDISYRYVWSADGEVIEGLTGPSVTFNNTSKGELWEVTVTPSDGRINGTAVTAEVVIVNTPPSVEAAFELEAPRTDDPIRLIVDESDPDLDVVSLDYRWVINGSPATETDDNLPAERTSKGEVWEVIITPNDGEVDGEPVTLAVTIANTPPSVGAATIEVVGDRPDRTAELVCVGTGWQDIDGDIAGYTTRWLVNDEVVDGAASETFAGGFARGDSVRCELTPFDGDDSGAAVTSDPVQIVNAPPTLDAVSIGPESPINTDEVSATLGIAVDPDGDPISFEYSWRVDGRVASTAETLVSSRFARGNEILLVVTPTDGMDPGLPVTSNSVEGGNNPPEIVSVALVPGTLYTDTTAEVELRATDADGDETTASVEWFVNGSKITPTTVSLDGDTWFDKGDEVYAVVRPDDGFDRGASATTSTLTVQNTAPTAPELTFSPAEPTETDDLVCEIDVASTDVDADAITYTFLWEVDGSVVSGKTTTYTNDTLDASSFGVDDKVICTVTASDGSDTSAPAVIRAGLETKELGFPSTTSSVRGGSLGTGGGGRFYQRGDYVTQTFKATGVDQVEEIEYEFEMDDQTSSSCTVGTLRFGIMLNGTEVEEYSYVGGSARGRITFKGTETFSALTGTGTDKDDWVLRIEAKDTVCRGGSSWNWYSGGTITLNP